MAAVAVDLWVVSVSEELARISRWSAGRWLLHPPSDTEYFYTAECQVCGVRIALWPGGTTLPAIYCACDQAARQLAEAKAYWGVLAEAWEET